MPRLDTKLLHPCMMGGPITDDDLPLTRTNELLALDALAAGTGTPMDVRTLRTSVHLTAALLALGYEAEGATTTLDTARAALREAASLSPGAMRCTGTALRDMVLLLDAMRATCGGGDYARALLRTRRELAR